jgi:hypothetical protein
MMQANNQTLGSPSPRINITAHVSAEASRIQLMLSVGFQGLQPFSDDIKIADGRRLIYMDP